MIEFCRPVTAAIDFDLYKIYTFYYLIFANFKNGYRVFML